MSNATNTSVSTAEPAQSECRALADILSRVGDKWTVMVVGALSTGPVRYNALLRQIDGVSPRMLTLTLKGLAVDGLVSRTLYPGVPPRVDYELTKLGHTLIEPLLGLFDWARAHQHEIQEARERAREIEASRQDDLRLPPAGPLS